MNPIRELLEAWGQWDLNPRPPAPRANTSTKYDQIVRVGILDQARRWPLRLRQMESFLNVVLPCFQKEIKSTLKVCEILIHKSKMKNLNPINLVMLILHKQHGLH